MPRKTTILIIILAAVTGVLLFLAISSERQRPSTPQTTIAPTKKPVAKTAKVFFNPSNLDLSAGSASPASTVEIMLGTGASDVAGVQTELQFDPKALVNVRLTPAVDSASFFGATSVVLFNDVNQTTGRISYAIAINAGGNARKGIGKIATLTFQKAFNSPSVTTVAFLDKTLVTILGENESVLKETMPLNITLSAQTTSPFVPVTTTIPSQ